MLKQEFQLRDGTLNQTYSSVSNCIITNETFDKCGKDSGFFMLDKRKGIIKGKSFEGIDIVDTLKVNGDSVFLGIDDEQGKMYLYNDNGDLLYEDDRYDFNPKKLVKGYGVGGQLLIDASNTSNNLDPSNIDLSDIPDVEVLAPYMIEGSPGLIGLNIPNNGFDGGNKMYITFTDGILKGCCNKILYADGDIVYIQGTNVYGSLPNNNDHYRIFSSFKENIIIGTKEGSKVISFTDIDPNIDNKYILTPTFESPYDFDFNINGNNISINSNNINDFKTNLNNELGNGYNYEVYLNSIKIYKNDGTSINLIDNLNINNITIINYNIGTGYPITLVEDNIYDIVNFSGSIFTLTDDSLFYSRRTIDDNVHQYPLDFLEYNNGFKLIPIGNSLSVFGNYGDNALIRKGTATINGTPGVTTYGAYDLEYEGQLYSKYSYIRKDGYTYLINSDKEMIGLSVNQINDSLFGLSTKVLSSSFNKKLDNIKGDVYLNSCGGNINVIDNYEGKSNTYLYDYSTGNYTTGNFNFPIYKYCDGENGILTGDSDLSGGGTISTMGGYLDFGEEYEQCVCFSMGWLDHYIGIYRVHTIFGVIDDDVGVDVKLNVNLELGEGSMHKKEMHISGLDTFRKIARNIECNRLVNDNFISYDGNVELIKSRVDLSGLYVQFKYCSYKRFILGKSVVYYNII